MNENLQTILFYLRNKRFAIKKMLTFIPPINEEKTEDTQIAYGIYFNSLTALIDFTKNKIENLALNNDKLSVLEQNLISIVGSDNNYRYIRELRNSIVHRGYDVLKMAYMYKNIMVPASPAILNKHNSKSPISYQSFMPSLFEIVKVTEKINPFIYTYCDNNSLLGFHPRTEKELEFEIQNSPYIPDYAKQLAKFSHVDIDALNKGLEEKYNTRIKLCFDTSDLLNSI